FNGVGSGTFRWQGATRRQRDFRRRAMGRPVRRRCISYSFCARWNAFPQFLRLNDDGTVPKDNPFVGKSGYRPEIYSIGHRTVLGLALHPTTGALWET